MKNDKNVQFLCKDCEIYNRCEYYYSQKENSYICKNFRLPSATPQQEPYKNNWDRLYNWLNDMRLDIAPDETITDKYERDIRLIQVDLIDELMEWMEQVESEVNDD